MIHDDFLPCYLHLTKYPVHMEQELFAGLCELRLFSLAFKQHHCQFLLQLGNGAAKCRLGHHDGFCSLRETPMTRQSLKIFQLC